MRGRGTDPYANLALEEFLLERVEPGSCILYLWQNQRTVVIGRNQNPWKECRVEMLETDGGKLARRLSGGGAVFHDLGNLNFTFLVRREDYDIPRQTQVILQAVELLGLEARRTGRNDITVAGRKFSGNAYYQTGDRCLHHGTILLDLDTARMARYLTVSQEKLRSKSVDSVQSRVANLREFLPDLTPDGMAEALVRAFGLVYGGVPEPFPQDLLDPPALAALTGRYGSWDWKYGRKISFSNEAARRFPWGELQLQLRVDGGRVAEARACSDALDPDYIAGLEAALPGRAFRLEGLQAAVDALPGDTPIRAEMARDIKTLMADFF